MRTERVKNITENRGTKSYSIKNLNVNGERIKKRYTERKRERETERKKERNASMEVNYVVRQWSEKENFIERRRDVETDGTVGLQHPSSL